MSRWRETTIGELCEGIFDGPHATPRPSDAGPVFLGIDRLNNGRLDFSETRHISDADFAKWTRRVTPRENDIVFSYETRLGEAAIVPTGLKCCLGRRMGLLRVNTSRADPKFLLYSYLGPDFQEVIEQRTIHGSTVERIALTELPSFPVCVPDLPTQRKISNLLGALDDKIELNRRMNRTLEEMAQALFKSWFVDFDPVVAKSEGRKPFGMNDEIAALFPDSFEESELGPIPKGWTTGPLALLVNVLGGGTPKTANPEYWDGDIPWFSVVDTPAEGDVFVFRTEKAITAEGVSSSAAQVYREGTTIISARGTVGNIAMMGTPMAFNQSCYGLTGTDGVGDSFVYFLTKAFVDDLRAIAHGSVFDTITRSSFETVKITNPPRNLIECFNDIVTSLLERIKSNVLENYSLRAMRDLLLPRLLSGEIYLSQEESVRMEVANA